MSSGTTSSAGGSASFSPAVMIGVVITGFIAFLAMMAMTGLAPQSDEGSGSTRTHANAVAASGYKGVATLLENEGWNVYRDRNGYTYSLEDEERALHIITPSPTTDPEALAKLLSTVRDDPILVILPKWMTAPDQKQKWARDPFYVPPAIDDVLRAVIPDDKSARVVPARGLKQPASAPGLIWASRITESGLVTVVPHPSGGAVLAETAGKNKIWILADPDLVNNLALATPASAERARRIITDVAADADASEIVFDLSLHGFGGGDRSLLRHAFSPPFVAATAILIATMLLAGWQALGRFGPAVRERRALAMSQMALIDSSAALLSQAGRDRESADDYVRLVREQAARQLHAPRFADNTTLERWLDRFTPPGEEPFTARADALRDATTPGNLLTRARALAFWRKDIWRDH